MHLLLWYHDVLTLAIIRDLLTFVFFFGTLDYKALLAAQRAYDKYSWRLRRPPRDGSSFFIYVILFVFLFFSCYSFFSFFYDFLSMYRHRFFSLFSIIFIFFPSFSNLFRFSFDHFFLTFYSYCIFFHFFFSRFLPDVSKFFMGLFHTSKSMYEIRTVHV